MTIHLEHGFLVSARYTGLLEKLFALKTYAEWLEGRIRELETHQWLTRVERRPVKVARNR